MNRSEPASAHATAVDEIAALVETLHRTEQRLETLTSGQVDTVTSAEGRTFLLRRAQGQLRLEEAVKQAAILNALPDHVALLDPRGVIVSVNDSWRRFGDANGLTLPDHGMGSSYLETCERSATLGSAVAERVAKGIRAVLAGTEPRFSIEYPCHSPGEQRWFVLTVTPLVAGQPRGAIVMHANVSERALAEASSHQTTALLQAVVDGTPDLVFVKGTDNRYLLCNAALARFHGRTTRDVLGRDDRDLYGAEEARDALMQDREAMRLGRAVDSESVITGVAGPRRMHHWKAPYRDDRGAMIGVIGVSRDVTEERRLTADLEAEQARLVAVQDVARIGSWSFDVTTKAYDWTLQTHLLFGTDPRQFVPTIESVRALIHPDDLPDVLAVTARSLERPGAAHRVEHRVRRVGAAERILEQRIDVSFDAAGKPVRALGTCQDITERRHAEGELRQKRAMLAMAGRLAQVGAWSVELPTLQVTWSDELALMHDEVRGFAPTLEQRLAYYAPEAVQTMRDAFERCVAEGVAFDVEHELITAGGRRIWARTMGEAVRDVDGPIRRVQGAVQDLTERKRAEEQVRSMALRLTDTLESITDGFLTVDQRLALLEASVSRLNDIVVISRPLPLAAQGRRIVFVNDAFVRATGHAREDVLGQSTALLAGPLTDAEALAALTRAVGRFEPLHTELVCYRKDGSRFWMELDLVPVGFEGEACSHFVSVGRDITERKRDKQALEELNAQLETRVTERTAQLNTAREQAEAANRAKSSFLAMMSHEIRTPMNGVIGMIDVLEQSRLRGGQIEIVRTVRESAHALMSIVDDVLDFSKIEAGQFQIDREPMDVASVIEGTCDSLGHLAAAKGVSLGVFVDPALPERSLGDAARLRQVLLNLVGNAIKFSSGPGRSGQISVRAQRVERGSAEAGLRIDVVDNGIGMDEEALSCLFRPFTQADSGTTRRFGGTGLGLSISRRLIELMGGTIEVRSKPGVGTTFSLLLAPSAAPPLGSADAASSSDAPALDGVACLVLGNAGCAAADLMVYLKHAGATARLARTPIDLQEWVSSCPLARGVVVIAETGAQADATLEACRAALQHRPEFRAGFVVLDYGRQRQGHNDPGDVQRLEGDTLRRRAFLAAVARAAGTAAPEAEPDTALGLDTLAGDLEAPTDVLRNATILIAEDNEINQRVLRRQLAIIGFAADVAATGREALELMARREYGLLLTDLHMPHLDGYELTKAIRATEIGMRRLPIVALTANAVKGEAKRCREIGMDDYMTKPLVLKELRAMLAKWLPLPAVDDPIELTIDGFDACTARQGAPAADLNVLAALVGSDPAVIEEMLTAFRRSAARCSADIREALGDGNTAAAANAAHTLKSGARSLGAQRLCDVCLDIEAAAEGRHPDGPTELLRRFDVALTALEEFLDPPRKAVHAYPA